MKSICMLLTSNVERDTRVLNEAETLSKDYEVTILVPDNGVLYTENKPFKVKKVKYFHSGLHLTNLFFIMKALIRAAYLEKADIYHGHDLHGLIIGFYSVKKLNKKLVYGDSHKLDYGDSHKLVYDSHELWSEMPHFKNLTGLRWVLPHLEKMGMSRVEQGITSDQSYADYLAKKYSKPFLALRNIPVLGRQDKNKVSLQALYPNKTIVLHTGFTGVWRGIEQAIESTQFLPDNFVLVFLGANRQLEVLKKLTKDLGVEDKVYFLPGVPPEELLATSAEADLAIALTQDVSLSYRFSLPNKLFQYLAAEVPVLGSNFPEYEKIIVAEKIGEVVDPSRPKDIAQKIIEMTKPAKQKEYRTNLKGLAARKYNWEDESKKLTEFYKNL